MNVLKTMAITLLLRKSLMKTCVVVSADDLRSGVVGRSARRAQEVTIIRNIREAKVSQFDVVLRVQQQVLTNDS